MTSSAIPLSYLSTCEQADFTAHLADIFEHSPWVAQRAWQHRPFSSLDALHRNMADAVRKADRAEQLALIRAHPELAGKLAEAGRLTQASTQEQQGAGLDQCSADELQRLRTLNAQYSEKFGFPFIIAVKGLNRYQIMDALEGRLAYEPEKEFQASLDEISKIARFRLEALITQDAGHSEAAVALKAKRLDTRAFAPFGDVIQVSDDVQHFTINDGNTERYHNLARLQPGPDGHIIVSLFRGQPRTLPFTITMMERHPHGSQAFIPTSGRPWLAVVAAPGPAPTADTLQLFYCRGDQGVNYAPGVWHHPLLALDAPSDFIVLDRSGPGENCDIITLAQPAVIESAEP